MENRPGEERYKALLEKQEKHGRLISCSYSLHHGATEKKNSDSFIFVSLQVRDGGQLITIERKEAFGGKTIQECRPRYDVLSIISELVGKYNLAALADLEEEDVPASSPQHSETALLCFDDALLGSFTSVSREIDFVTVRHFGGGKICDKYARLLFASVFGSELISERKT